MEERQGVNSHSRVAFYPESNVPRSGTRTPLASVAGRGFAQAKHAAPVTDRPPGRFRILFSLNRLCCQPGKAFIARPNRIKAASRLLAGSRTMIFGA